MQLQPEETLVACHWSVEGTSVRADSNCDRIKWLISKSLKKIAKANGGWDTLYIDENDGRYWEHTYPQSEMQGGGPDQLQYIGEKEALAKYGVVNPGVSGDA